MPPAKFDRVLTRGLSTNTAPFKLSYRTKPPTPNACVSFPQCGDHFGPAITCASLVCRTRWCGVCWCNRIVVTVKPTDAILGTDIHSQRPSGRGEVSNVEIEFRRKNPADVFRGTFYRDNPRTGMRNISFIRGVVDCQRTTSEAGPSSTVGLRSGMP